MGRSFLFALFVSLAAGGWYISQHYEFVGLDQVRVVPIGEASPSGTGGQVGAPPARAPQGNAIRIASFNIQMLGRKKMSKPEVVARLVDIIRRFDVVAVQEVRSKYQDVVARLVAAVNADGRHYDYVLGPRVGRTNQKEQFAFIFDTETLEVDRSQVYTINDPSDLLHRPPLVAWFRVRGVDPDAAFTFLLVNVHNDPDEAAEELRWMPEVLRQVARSGKGEDDVILLGDFNAGTRQILATFRRELRGTATAIGATPTNTRMTKGYDNIVFTLPATSEFQGEAGVFDMLRTYNLSLQQALEISDHNPVWATFSALEGAGRL